MTVTNILETSRIIDTISGLETAASAHIEWLKRFHRIIICSLPFDEKLSAVDAHTHCDFGHWYVAQDESLIPNLELYRQIGETHREFHQVAGEILRGACGGCTVEEGRYDRFMTTIITFNDMLRRLQSELWGKISSSDPLTGLKSWHRLLSPAEAMGEIGTVTGKACAVMVDLDHFKRVNDTYGHQAGDEVLSRVGQALQQGVRPNDLVYRYGGEEFLIYLGGAGMNEAGRICERLRQQVADLSFDLPGEKDVHITASFGIALADKGISIDDVVTRCDLALYAAKSGGRNTIYYWYRGEVGKTPPLPITD